MFSEITILVIVYIFLFILGIIIVKFDDDSTTHEKIFSVLLRLIITLIMSIIGILFIKHIDAEPIEHYDEKCYRIYSLKNMNETTGTFVLGGGKIENTEYYYFYRKSNEGYFRGKIEVENTKLFETNLRHPALYERKYIFDSKTGLVDWSNSSKNEPEYILNVPHGTVSNRFEAY